jgi:hypothetical protein
MRFEKNSASMMTGLDPSGDYRGDRRACDAHFRESALSEDQKVVERNVDDVSGHVRKHHGLRIAASGEEAADGGPNRLGDGTEHENGEIDALLFEHRRSMAADLQDKDPQRNERQHDRPGEQREPDALHGRNRTLPVFARAMVLRHEGVRIGRQRKKPADHREAQNARRHGGAERLGTVPAQEHAIAKIQQRKGAGADDQRPRNPHQFPVAAKRTVLCFGAMHRGRNLRRKPD